MNTSASANPIGGEWKRAIETRGIRFVLTLLRASRRGESLPPEAVDVLAEAFREFVNDSASSADAANALVRVMNLRRQRGRPRQDGFERAWAYWDAREEGATSMEAYQRVAAKYGCDERTVQRDVQRNPDIDHVHAEIADQLRAQGARDDK